MKKIRILIAEDDPIYEDMFRMYLDRMDYEIVAFTNKAEEVLNLAAATSPDLALLDIQLAGKQTGIETARLLNNLRPLPIIFVTALREKDVFTAAMETDPYAYLIKPFDYDNLKSAIELAVHKFYHHNVGLISETLDSRLRKLQEEQVFVRHNGLLTKINVNELTCIEASDKESILHFVSPTASFNVRNTLRSFKERLPSYFLQVHRSFLVNLRQVVAVDTAGQQIELPGRKVPLGQNFKKEFFDRLSVVE